MKKTLQVLTLATVLVFAFATVASAKYASYDNGDNYLSWAGANVLYNAINGTTGATQTSPHGGYTQTSVKCAVCHSVHRAFSGASGTALTAPGLGDNSLLTNGGISCVACHASWGASPSSALVEVSQSASSGPHLGTGGDRCTNRECHGSVHGMHPSDYATVRKYNLTNIAEGKLTADGLTPNIDSQLDHAIAAGNVNSEISQDSLTPGMKAFVTGYVCSPCHGYSQFSVATTDETAGSVGTTFGGAVLDGAGATVIRTGHPSAGNAQGYVPTCEGCHDLVGVATGTTAFPHADSGISVYGNGRFNHEEDNGALNATNPAVASVSNPTGIVAGSHVYGLWMTSNSSGASDSAATAISSPDDPGTSGFTLQDGACLKCHDASATSAHPLP